jgi:hypothetical protein
MTVAERLREMDAKATKGPWELATQVERGEHARVPIGLVSGCVVAGEPHHDCRGDNETVACVKIEFGHIHLNDGRKPPTHPDNRRDMATARTVIALRNALPALARVLDAADVLSAHAKEWPTYSANGQRYREYSAALAELAKALGGDA